MISPAGVGGNQKGRRPGGQGRAGHDEGPVEGELGRVGDQNLEEKDQKQKDQSQGGQRVDVEHGEPVERGGGEEKGEEAKNPGRGREGPE